MTNQVTIKTLSHDGRGIAQIEGKTIFLAGGLPGEEVVFKITRKHKNYNEGFVTEVLKPSIDRVAPPCPHYDICGGCSLQHLAHAKQIALKEQVMLEQLQHFGNVIPKELLPPLVGPIWGYRNRARLAVKYVQKKQKLLVGFHEKNGRYIADISQCLILPPQVGQKISLLGETISKLSVFADIPQIEVAIGDHTTTLVFRNLKELSLADKEILSAFGREHNFQICLQPGNLTSITSLTSPVELSYTLPESKIELLFKPGDFTQINPEVNRQMVNQALKLLAPTSTDTILDLFCGLGNFTLSFAKLGAKTLGIEGSAVMVERAKINAAHNNIANAEFYAADLTQNLSGQTWSKIKYTKIILDPPRTGALEIAQQLEKFTAEKILYISCNPATLARDAKEIINKGYELKSAGIIDMFPHTSHVESMVLFERL